MKIDGVEVGSGSVLVFNQPSLSGYNGVYRVIDKPEVLIPHVDGLLRGTGRTYRMLWQAAQQMKDGKKVLVVMAGQPEVDMAMREVHDILNKSKSHYTWNNALRRFTSYGGVLSIVTMTDDCDVNRQHTDGTTYERDGTLHIDHHVRELRSERVFAVMRAGRQRSNGIYYWVNEAKELDLRSWDKVRYHRGGEAIVPEVNILECITTKHQAHKLAMAKINDERSGVQATKIEVQCVYGSNSASDQPEGVDEMDTNRWKTHDGRVMTISAMSTDHLSNAINLLRSRGHMTEREVADRLKDVNAVADNDLVEQLIKCTHPKLQRLIDEYESRPKVVYTVVGGGGGGAGGVSGMSEEFWRNEAELLREARRRLEHENKLMRETLARAECTKQGLIQENTNLKRKLETWRNLRTPANIKVNILKHGSATTVGVVADGVQVYTAHTDGGVDVNLETDFSGARTVSRKF